MIAIQADESGKPVVIEGPDENRKFHPVSPERWRAIVGEEIDLSDCDRPIIPVQAAPELLVDALKAQAATGAHG